MEDSAFEAYEAGNREQAEAWNGSDGDHWIAYEDHYNAVVERQHRHLMEAARISPTDVVLDVGCGCGESTRDAARLASSGSALGIDLSGRMIARARERSLREGVTNAAFEHGDAQIYPLAPETFHLAISRYGAMFFSDPVAAFANVRRALKPRGRLALLVWQELDRNEWLLQIRGALALGRALPEPPRDSGALSLGDPATAKTVLRAAGFENEDLTEVDEPVRLGTDAGDAYDFLSGISITRGLLGDLDTARQTEALARLRRVLEAHESDDGVMLPSRSWLVTADVPS